MREKIEETFEKIKNSELVLELRSDLAKLNYGAIATAFSVGALTGLGIVYYPSKVQLVEYYIFAFPCLAAIVGGICIVFSQPYRSILIARLSFIASLFLLMAALVLYLIRTEQLDPMRFGLTYRAVLAYLTMFFSLGFMFLRWESDWNDPVNILLVWVLPISSILLVAMLLP